jgi:hypothetical protein
MNPTTIYVGCLLSVEACHSHWTRLLLRRAWIPVALCGAATTDEHAKDDDRHFARERRQPCSGFGK